MSRLKKIIIILSTAALAICSAPFVSYLLTDDINVEIEDSYSGLTYSDGRYYYIDTDKSLKECGIPDKTIVEGNVKSFCIDDGKLYCFARPNGKKSSRTVLYVFDKETGNAQGEFEVPDGIHGEVHDGIVYVKYIQKITGNPYLRFYDINNDFREVFVVNEKKEMGSVNVFTFENGYQMIISPEKEVVEYNSDHLITLEAVNKKDSKLSFDYFEQRAPSYYDMSNLQTWKVVGDKLYTVCTATRFFGGDKKNSIRHNKFDAVKVYDTETGVAVNEKQFQRSERVLSVNDDTIITYLNGDYIWYDSRTFEELKREASDEIINGNDYTVSTTEGIVFIFSGEKMIGRLAHSIS